MFLEDNLLTQPRVETVLELRPIAGVPFTVRSVGVELKTVQKVTIPTKLSSTESQQEYVIYNNPFAFRPPVGDFSQRLLGLDIPILFPLPKDIISSGIFPNSQAATLHYLLVRIACGVSHDKEVTFVESFPISIKTYDTLPIYRQFNEPLTDVLASNDNQVIVEVVLPHTAVGPEDDFIVNTKVATNHLHNKISRKLRLKQLTFQIKEIIECHEGGLPPKREVKLYTTTRQFDGDSLDTGALSSAGIKTIFNIAFPVESSFLSLFKPYDFLRSSDELASTKIVKEVGHGKLDEGIPITHIQGFTTAGKYFSIRFEMVIKVKLVHSKDMEIRLPLTVSPYDRATSEYLLQWIMKQCLTAREKFGSGVINSMINTHNYGAMVDLLVPFTPPPIVYRYRKQDWIRLGYNGDAFGSNTGKSILNYID